MKFDAQYKKEELVALLRHELKGVARVPALLTRDPMQNIATSVLSDYTVFPCEPLHDLKGHINNVLTEVQAHMPREAAQDLKEMINNTVDPHKGRGCDWRHAVMLAAAKLPKTTASHRVIRMIRSLAEITSICYLPEAKRTPKLVLHLALCLWRHFGLLKQVCSKPKMTLDRLYGGYLHGLLHTPQQLMIVSLRSCNTEALERFQGISRAISEATSSRRPQEVAKNAVVRLQAELAKKADPATKAESAIGHSYRQLQPLRRMLVDTEALTTAGERQDFMALQRQLASILCHGPGTWWHRDGRVVIFHDTDTDPPTMPQGPKLLSFRSTTLQTVEIERARSWAYIMDNHVELPLQDEEGDHRNRADTEAEADDVASLISEDNEEASVAKKPPTRPSHRRALQLRGRTQCVR